MQTKTITECLIDKLENLQLGTPPHDDIKKKKGQLCSCTYTSLLASRDQLDFHDFATHLHDTLLLRIPAREWDSFHRVDVLKLTESITAGGRGLDIRDLEGAAVLLHARALDSARGEVAVATAVHVISHHRRQRHRSACRAGWQGSAQEAAGDGGVHECNHRTI
jgi:hypothetical protein